MCEMDLEKKRFFVYGFDGARMRQLEQFDDAEAAKVFAALVRSDHARVEVRIRWTDEVIWASA